MECDTRRRRRTLGGSYTCDSRRRAPVTMTRTIAKPVECLIKALTDFEFVPKEPCGSGTALSTPCSDLESVSAKLRGESRAGAQEWAARVIDRVATEAGVFYNDPKIAYDLSQAENALSLMTELKDGYLTLQPNEGMANFISSNNIKSPADFSNVLRTRPKASQWKKLAAVGLDVVGSLAGPAGVALSVVGAYLDFYATADAQSAQALFAKALYTEMMKEVKAMVLDSNTDSATRFFNEQKAAVKGWLKGFASEYRTISEQLTVVRKAKMARSGLTQLLLLNSLMLDVGSTRFQWLKGAIDDFHCHVNDIPRGCSWASWEFSYIQRSYGRRVKVKSKPGFGDYAKSQCVMFRNNLFLFISPLISLHISLIHAATLLSTGVGGMAGVLQGKLFEMVREYKAYLDKFERSTCMGNQNWNMCNQKGKITLCVPYTCASWCDLPQNDCAPGQNGGCGAMNQDWPVWTQIVRMKESLATLLSKQSTSLLQTAANTTSHAAAIASFEEQGSLAKEFTAICGGFSCLVGEPSEAQLEALKGLSRRAVAELQG